MGAHVKVAAVPLVWVSVLSSTGVGKKWPSAYFVSVMSMSAQDHAAAAIARDESAAVFAWKGKRTRR